MDFWDKFYVNVNSVQGLHIYTGKGIHEKYVINGHWSDFVSGEKSFLHSSIVSYFSKDLGPGLQICTITMNV